ncbi:MAG: ATP-binding cassette domain-containing protein [Thermomicrobiales bacterium]
MLLEVQDLTKVFDAPGGGRVTAVNGVSFSLDRGQTLGLVGESGSGKSTVARLVLRLIEPTSGAVRFDGVDLLAAPENELRGLRQRMQMVFQDPYSSLLPHFTAGANVAEPLRLHGRGDRHARRDDARRILERVGLTAGAADRYPHEFSGGQQQRIAIARAIALQPDLLICDEPTSSLDVSIQAQILNLLADLQQQYGLTFLFISHNLAVIEHLATHVAVMRRGRLVEVAPKETLFQHALHPYTHSLLSAVLPVRGAPTAPRHGQNGRRPTPTGGNLVSDEIGNEAALVEVSSGHFVAADYATTEAGSR